MLQNQLESSEVNFKEAPIQAEWLSLSPVDDVEHLNERVIFKEAEVGAEQVRLHFLLYVEPDLQQSVLQLLLYVALTHGQVRHRITAVLRLCKHTETITVINLKQLKSNPIN